ncbi:DUF1566 domain-containing protein [Methylomonas sp. EFPC1]|uniref:PEP-CTERM sorting domain-containing protein n=1 Tax=Methylomonas sp. EFPC1 TaxID=2812647 RepID=UPI00196874FA|nr:PEP-CTERM sorting domain-containing protein [Methylomonas sp. EFPC1]QSB03212.1 DUF1566 domain-containing protein [Methylomonas sp. EFPC1]
MSNFSRAALASTLVLSIGFAGSSSAALYDRGGGLLYDDRLNVTWLQDASFFRTQVVANPNLITEIKSASVIGSFISESDFNTTLGIMSWWGAQSWVAYLNSQNFNGYNDWRLPVINPSNGISFNYNYSVSGSSDAGFNITSPTSELSYMFYSNLGLKGFFGVGGEYQSDYGVQGNGTYGFGLAKNVVPVINLEAFVYWYGTPFTRDPFAAWNFGTMDGDQGSSSMDGKYYAWAVRDGDVAAVTVPEPSIIWLFLTGFGLLAFNRGSKGRSVTSLSDSSYFRLRREH